MATTHTDFGRFKAHYRELARGKQLATTPLILSEGDSWFSTPLYNNIVDWLEVKASQAVFLRLEESGDLALDIFSGSSLRAMGSRLKSFEFDVLLLSAGGNDFVDKFLRETFRGAKAMSVDAAIERVVDTERFEHVHAAWRRALDTAFQSRPGLTVITHTYAYPRLLGTPAKLSPEQAGLLAIF